MKTFSSSVSPLIGKTFVLELGRDIRFKAKQELINYLREQNAHISYILTASTDYVLVSSDIDTYKTRRARQLGITLVNVEYIYECRKSLPVDIKRFIVTSAEDKENFSKTGTIPISGAGGSSTTTVKPGKCDLSKIKIWNSDDVELPRFDELTHAEIGKSAIFKETNENSDVYFALELQIIPEEKHSQTNNDYRLRFRYEKQTITASKGKLSLIQYASSDDINELHQLFASYYYRIATMPRITRIRDLLPDKLGSKLLLRSLFVHRIDTQMLDDNVCQLIESLWIESIGDLDKILSVQPESIALKTIIEAEAALLEIKSNSESSSEAETRFYSLIRHRPSFVVDLINDRRALIDKLDLCQMLRDMLTVNELTNWNIKASIEAKYRALKCHIEAIESDSHEYRTINDMISSSTNQNERVIVHQIYSVAKQTDALNFRSTLFNQKQLFHGSRYNNFLGILSRGLLMPKMVVNDLGITRTDIGCLGYGIYFSDSVSTSLKYTTPSTTRPGRRLLCISQVALGESAKFYSYASNLIQPPEHFHSTHGVKKTNENNSKFIDDEYTIYNLDQQRLLYLVEVSWMPHDVIHQPPKLLPITRDQFTNRSIPATNKVDIPSTIEDEVIQVAEQDYGLICPSSGKLVPLKAFHIRAQLVDVTAEVVLYQVYHNTSSIPIEAKYVFPLDENCSVCGFEAHINNKIIKGVVKEKEQAKREYREAIEKGHGAYLMHQEQPEVFSVSVGNLPANCEVIIKITYVAELPIENNDIIFRLPAKVASWQSKQALEMKDQTIVPSINLEQDDSSMKSVEFSLKTSIRMPYEITKLFSPTHRLRRKITDCLAMVELVDNILFEKDFILSITLKSVNLPRMLNETFVPSDDNSQACMLTFYPKFEMTNNSNEYVEIVFIIDVSNSMDGNHVQQAKQLAHLFLTNMKIEDGNILFNIVTFGSDNDECFPISSPNTKENIDKAKHFVLHSLDHRGNTDLFSVLRQYSLLPSPSKLGRQFILLSDGHINDLTSILTLFENQSSMRHDRLFTCSIGDISNKHNLKQLANGANGGGLTTVFDSNYRSRWKTKVLHILEHIRQPCVTNISIDWHGTIDNQQGKFTTQAPKQIRSLFNGMRLTVYRFIQNCHKATLTAMINDQEFVTTVFSNKITETQGRILHCLAARAIIQDYENGLLHNDESENELIKKQYKQDLIELSIKYSVVSSFTSFVAIEERDGQALEPGVRLLDVMLENDIDLLPYIGWDGDRSQIDTIKEKLIYAKRSFDSASIANKIDLSNEYEILCQNISYRSGGDAKFDLMLTIIETYRSTLNQNEKARELERKMAEDLINEMNNATADEKKILEKRLNDISLLIDTEEIERLEDPRSIDGATLSLCDDYFGDMMCFDEIGGGGGGTDELFCYQEKEPSTSSSNEQFLYKQSISREILLTKQYEVEAKETEMEESDEDMGFGLFDNGDGITTSTKSLTSVKSSVIENKKAAMWSSDGEDEEEDDDDCAMGFDLFGDDEPVSFPTKTFDKKEKSILVDAEQIKSAPVIQKASMDSVRDKQSLITTTTSSALRKDESFEKKSYSYSWKSSPPMMKAAPIMQQQQQQTTIQSEAPNLPLPMIPPRAPPATSSKFFVPTQPSYSPTSPSLASLMAQTSYRLSRLASTSSSFLQADADDDSINTSPIFTGFGGQTTLSAAVAPPPPPPLASFSFGSSVQSKFSAPAATQQSQVSSGMFSFPSTNQPTFPTSTMGPPLPPPPPPSASFSFGSSGQSTFSAPAATQQPQISSTLFSFASAHQPTFPTSTMGPPPPPPPPPVPGAFGSSGQSAFFTSAAINRPSSSSTGFSFASTNQTTFSNSTAGPPRPPPASFSFGSSGSSNTNAPTLPAIFGAPGMGINQTYDYLPLLQQPSASPFGGEPFIPITKSDPFRLMSVNGSAPSLQQSSLFGGNITSTTANVIPSTAVNQSMFMSAAAQSCLPTSSLFGSSNTTTNSYDTPPVSGRLSMSTSTADPFSMRYAFASSDAPVLFEDESESIIAMTDSIDRDERSAKPIGRVSGTIAYLPMATSSIGGKTLQSEMQTATVTEDFEATLDASTKKCHSELTNAPNIERQKMSAKKSLRKFKRESIRSSDRESNERSEAEGRSYSSKTALQDLLLLDVTPLSLGIEDLHGHMCTIISRNRTIPTRTEFYPIFTNAYAYQTTATIRVFRGEHKLTKYNTFIGELTLTNLTPNFASQTLEISIRMDIDANGILQIDAEESRSGAKASIKIDPRTHPLSNTDIERHMEYVESDPDYKAPSITNRKPNDPLYMLIGQTENSTVNFTGESEISSDFSTFDKIQNIDLTSTTISELKRIQFTDGSFDLNEDLANLLSTDFDELKKYLCKQGFNSFALNTQNEILHLIATGIMIIELLLQVSVSERKAFLVPFDKEQIRSVFHLHLPKILLDSADKAIDFYEQTRLRYGIYCEQLELKYSSWEKFIQCSIFGIKI